MRKSVGFTGSRHGMTDSQKRIVYKLLRDWDLWNYGSEINKAHNGGCIGSDEEFEEICDELDIPSIRWPANNVALKYVSQKEPKVSTIIYSSRASLERNGLIVLNSHRLIATPRGSYNPRSGTWYTIHHAVEANKRVYLIQEDGLVDVR
jgi:hypothetical protein